MMSALNRYDRAGARRRAGELGFTMLEMLVVIAIILILSGVVYRISSYVTQKAGRARTVFEIELLHNILEEYYAVYGHYPPTSGNAYTDFQNRFGENRYPPNWDNYVGDPTIGPQLPIWTGPHGLTYYITMQYRYGGVAPAPEVQAYNDRWAHYFDELDYSTSLEFQGLGTDQFGEEGGTINHSNYWGGIHDPYRNLYVYEGIAPDYQSYLLYSAGPDGTAGTPDDIGRDRWSE